MTDEKPTIDYSALTDAMGELKIATIAYAAAVQTTTAILRNWADVHSAAIEAELERMRGDREREKKFQTQVCWQCRKNDPEGPGFSVTRERTPNMPYNDPRMSRHLNEKHGFAIPIPEEA